MASMAKGVMAFVVGAALSLYAFSYVAVPAITELFNAETTAWDSGSAALLGIIPVFIMITIAVKFAAPALNEL